MRWTWNASCHGMHVDPWHAWHGMSCKQCTMFLSVILKPSLLILYLATTTLLGQGISIGQGCLKTITLSCLLISLPSMVTILLRVWFVWGALPSPPPPMSSTCAACKLGTRLVPKVPTESGTSYHHFLLPRDWKLSHLTFTPVLTVLKVKLCVLTECRSVDHRSLALLSACCSYISCWNHFIHDIVVYPIRHSLPPPHTHTQTHTYKAGTSDRNLSF